MTHRRSALRVRGLSDQQWRVLRVLAEKSAGVDTGQIARDAFISSPSLSGVLARMERDGLIARSRDPADQRRTVVDIKPAGLKLVKQLAAPIEAHYDVMEQQLGKDKLSQLYALLDAVIAMDHHPKTSP